jgi:hypothetical protein
MLERVGCRRPGRSGLGPDLTGRDLLRCELDIVVGQPPQPLLGFAERLGLGEGLVQPRALPQPVPIFV